MRPLWSAWSNPTLRLNISKREPIPSLCNRDLIALSIVTRGQQTLYSNTLQCDHTHLARITKPLARPWSSHYGFLCVLPSQNAISTKHTFPVEYLWYSPFYKNAKVRAHALMHEHQSHMHVDTLHWHLRKRLCQRKRAHKRLYFNAIESAKRFWFIEPHLKFYSCTPFGANFSGK